MIEHKKAQIARTLRDLLSEPDHWELRTEQFGEDSGRPIYISLIRIWRDHGEQRLTMQEALSDHCLEHMAMSPDQWIGWVVQKWRDEVARRKKTAA